MVDDVADSIDSQPNTCIIANNVLDDVAGPTSGG